MSDLMKKVVAEEVKAARKAKKLKQEELANKVGMEQQRISEIESGEHAIRIDTLAKIAEGLGMPLRVFFEEENLDELAEAYHASRSFVFPVGLLKQLEAQARRESKNTNEYMIEALNRQVKEDSRSHYRPVFTDFNDVELTSGEQEGLIQIAS